MYLCPAAFVKDFCSRGAEAKPVNRAPSARWPLLAIGIALLLLPGCNALNPLCSSARPAPVVASLSASTITLAQAQQGFVLTVTGKKFVSSSVVIINGSTLSTTVQSSTQLQVTIPTDLISAPGAADVTVKTPAGNSIYEGCSSGGRGNPLIPASASTGGSSARSAPPVAPRAPQNRGLTRA